MSAAPPNSLTTRERCDAAFFGLPLERATGLAVDSRKVRAGNLFLAFPGTRDDGRRHIPEAIAAGASAVLWETGDFTWNEGWRIPHFAVPDLRNRLGEIASRFYDQPSQAMWVAGVTGTNGKTSCAHWIAQSMNRLGRKTAVMGTLGNGFPGELEATTNTTADAVTLQASLAAYRDAGAAGCVMEVSSHGIEQGRVSHVNFDVALLTNLSRDHLDYHKTMEAYAASKAKLFHWPNLKHAVINLDDRFGKQLADSIDRSKVEVLGYGFGAGEIAGERLELTTRGLSLEIRTPWGAAQLKSSLLGAFNAANLLGTLGVLISARIDLQDAVDALARVEPVAGRLQKVNVPGAPLVVIDYAHSPDALEKALQTLRASLSGDGKLYCVFGCGGDRDPGKRPLMGEVATRLADQVIITSDNPRSENPRQIIDAIARGARPNYQIEEDRAAAIRAALEMAGASDVVLIAGKGHETYQEIGGRKLPFDDADIARRLLRHEEVAGHA
jgi:UDP-N-acetylmuramoyl-L-alanyl-D-glutamate--2,6-diaminopimelate ligase